MTNQNAPNQTMSDEHSPAVRGNGILLVEDEAVVAMDLAEQLEEMGYRVCAIADNGADARSLAERHRPEVILMDVILKGPVDGIEVAADIAAAELAPVVFLTAFSDLQTVRRAARTSPFGYLTKPFQRGEVRAAVEVAIQKFAVERALRERERWCLATMHAMPQGIITVDLQQRVRFMNESAQQVLGIERGQGGGLRLDDLLAIENHGPGGAPPDGPSSPVVRALRDGAAAASGLGEPLLTADGQVLPLRHSAAPIRDGAGATIGAVVAMSEAGQRLAPFELLRQSEERFRAAFNFAPVGMALLSLEMQFLHANPAMCNLLGRPAEELTRLHRDHITHEQDCATEDQHLAQLVAGHAQVVEFEKRFLDAEGQSVWALVSAALLQRDGLPVSFVYQVYDLRRRKEVERRLSTLARTDSLTGLANRRYWREEADRCIAEAHRSGRNVGVLFLDLDNFKCVNDSLGHVAGDQLLKLVAQRLRRVVRSSDVIARYGGDEFLILLTDLASRTDVAIVARKLIETVRKRFVLDAGPAQVGLSVGAAVFPFDGSDTRSLLKAADNALYGAKARGRNRVQFSVPLESSAAE
jgi:diguanylate cyclase (GGDEF)-like protein/PAS domain S-box-containing protein